MIEVIELIRKAARCDAAVLLGGESGTGKELVAQEIHSLSIRSGARLVPLNLASLALSVLESELFGHEKGAFTGATSRRIGKFEYAHRGTLFLDEIAEVPLPVQVKILRVLEYWEFARVGSNDPLRINTRVIAATNKDLVSLIREGRFREDLYHRLSVIKIELPPLRERLEDLELIISEFLTDFSEVRSRPVPRLASSVLERFYAYSWPGNLRELRNAVEGMMALNEDGILCERDLPAHIRASMDQARPPGRSVLAEQSPELLALKGALDRNRWNITLAAKELSLHRSTVHERIRKYGLVRPGVR